MSPPNVWRCGRCDRPSYAAPSRCALCGRRLCSKCVVDDSRRLVRDELGRPIRLEIAPARLVCKMKCTA